jgi:hypothetical protein
MFSQNSKNESQNGSQSSEASMFIQENVNNLSSATEKLIKSSLNVFGHRHSSSYDASYIKDDESKEVSNFWQFCIIYLIKAYKLSLVNSNVYQTIYTALSKQTI